MKAALDEAKPAVVSEGTTQAGEPHPRDWEWVERHLWTERMLEALVKGVRGGVWFSLIDKVQRPSTLAAAWSAVKRNVGSAGSDRQSIEDFEKDLAGEITRLSEALCTGSYRPRPIRRGYIDKPGSKEKPPLGIPCVRDRVVQGALRVAIEPIFENVFVSHSYGFRPGRGCKDALREVVKLLHAGYTHVVDADIKAYFDNIPHEPLMADIGCYIADGRVLDLIGSFLKQDVLEDLTLWTPEKGSPQGAVISPLLANIYLNDFDRAFHEGAQGPKRVANARLVRYADDFVALARWMGPRIRTWLESKLEGYLGLSLNREKTSIVRMSEGKATLSFLGFGLRYCHDLRGRNRKYLNVFPSEKAIARIRDRIRSLTGSGYKRPLRDVIGEVNQALRGWGNYFSYGYPRKAFRDLNHFVRCRFRRFLLNWSQRRSKPFRYGESLYAGQRRCGLTYL